MKIVSNPKGGYLNHYMQDHKHTALPTKDKLELDVKNTIKNIGNYWMRKNISQLTHYKLKQGKTATLTTIDDDVCKWAIVLYEYRCDILVNEFLLLCYKKKNISRCIILQRKRVVFVLIWFQ